MSDNKQDEVSDTLSGVSDTKERQAIKRVIEGEPALKVAKEMGIPRQTLSTWVAGVRHFKLDVPASVSDAQGECAECQTLKEEIERLKVELSDSRRVSDSYDDIPPGEPEPCGECQTLSVKIKELETENEALKAELETLRASGPAVDEVAPSAELPGIEFSNVCFTWSDLAEIKRWIEEMGQQAENIVSRWAVWRVVYRAWQVDETEFKRLRACLSRLSKAYIKEKMKNDPTYTPPRQYVEDPDGNEVHPAIGFLLDLEIRDEEKEAKANRTEKGPEPDKRRDVQDKAPAPAAAAAVSTAAAAETDEEEELPPFAVVWHDAPAWQRPVVLVLYPVAWAWNRLTAL